MRSDSTKSRKDLRRAGTVPLPLLESEHIQMHHKVKVSKGNDVSVTNNRVQTSETTKPKSNNATENVTILSGERKDSVNEVNVIA
jgi:hypothetical protein